MFEEKLKSLCHTASGPYLRPFGPNPNWKSAPCFVVGENPATPLRDEFSSFGEYWQGLTLDPDIFIRKYATRHNGGTTNTTKRVNELTQLVASNNCLVTNVCWYPSKSGQPVPRHEWSRGAEHLSQLIGYCKPKVLFFHGGEACKFAEEFFGIELRYAPPQEQQVFAGGSLIFAYHHFSGQGLRRGAQGC